MAFRAYRSDTVIWDYASILATTLFTFQDFSCDKEYLVMRCPEGTSINIQWAQYGRQLPSQQKCPDFQVLQNSSASEDTACLVNSSLDVVYEKCQHEKRCKLLVSAQTFGEENDPCPDTSKYLEVAYQCRPKQFRSRQACEGDELQLTCAKHTKLAIYSASFGHSLTQNDNGKCGRNLYYYDAECHSRCALQIVIDRCHSRRRCSVPSTEGVFGNPCQPGTSKQLNIVYTCVSRRILRELTANDASRFCQEGQTEPEFPPPVGAPVDTPPIVTSHGPKPYTMDPSGEMGPPQGTSVPAVAPVQEESSSAGFINNWLTVGQFIKENKEKFVLYIVVSVLIGIILVLILVIVRLRFGKSKRKTKRGKLDISSRGDSPNVRTAAASASVWEAGLSPSEADTLTPVSPASPPLPTSKPEESQLLSTPPGMAAPDMDTTGDTDDGYGVVFAPHRYRTLPTEPYTNNQYNNTPKTFASPSNGTGQYHSYTLSVGQRPSNNLYNNQFRTSPVRTNSLPRYESQGSSFDNYYR